MNITLDHIRGNKVARHLYHCFLTTGIHGRSEMPEDELPKGMEKGSLEHIFFITLTTSIDYMRDANVLWKNSRKTYEDPETRYLFDPKMLSDESFEKILVDMQKHQLSLRPTQDAGIWKTIGSTFHGKWQDDPREFLSSCDWNSLNILERLRKDNHSLVPDFPFLRGAKIGPLWLRMLRDNTMVYQIQNLELVPIPVDVHVARSTLATGVVRGNYSGSLENIYSEIRKAWFSSVKNLQISDRPMIALDIDESLWHLSRYGCSSRNNESGFCLLKNTCEAKEFCVPGKIAVGRNRVEINT